VSSVSDISNDSGMVLDIVSYCRHEGLNDLLEHNGSVSVVCLNGKGMFCLGNGDQVCLFYVNDKENVQVLSLNMHRVIRNCIKLWACGVNSNNGQFVNALVGRDICRPVCLSFEANCAEVALNGKKVSVSALGLNSVNVPVFLKACSELKLNIKCTVEMIRL
jgi:hypothetical protein